MSIQVCSNRNAPGFLQDAPSPAKKSCSLLKILGVTAVVAALVSSGRFFFNSSLNADVTSSNPTVKPKSIWLDREGLCIPTVCEDLFKDPDTLVEHYYRGKIKITMDDIQYVTDYPTHDHGKPVYHWYRGCDVRLKPEAYERVSSQEASEQSMDFYKSFVINDKIKPGFARAFNLLNDPWFDVNICEG